MVPHGNFVNQGMVIPRKYVKIKKCEFLVETLKSRNAKSSWNDFLYKH